MIWLTWRQIRAQLLAVYLLVVASAVVLAITGPRIADLAKGDANIYDLLTGTDRALFNAGIVVVAVAPAIIGIFWGAPLVARELETGTHRLVWNQSVTRTRWLATKLGLATVATVVAVGVLTTAVSWWAQPIDGAQSSTNGSLPSRLAPITFAMRGVVPVGYAVFALVLGTVIGLVLRRSVPAMALTLAIYVAVQVAVPLWVRPHLIPPTTENVTISTAVLDGILADSDGGPFKITTRTADSRDWILSNETVTANGKAAALPSWFSGCLPPPPSGPSGGTVEAKPEEEALGACFARLSDEGYRQRVVYQPHTNFWRLQWAETALYGGASAALAGLGFWWTRRKLS